MVAKPFHDREVPRVHVNRGLLGWGVFFIVAGSIPVLVQAGVLDPQVVRRVWQLWPLILIGIGLGLILQRTRAGIIGGLIVAATFGILVGGWFAVGFAPGAGLGACGVGGSDPGTPFRDTYVALLQTVRATYPHTFIVCIIAPLLNGGDLNIISGHIRAAVDARNAAGDTNVEFFSIPAQTSDKYACQYHPNAAENVLMGDMLAGELRAKLGW